jgi:hypothetical protein
MSDADPAKVYAKLRADAAKLLNLDANKMSALESMQCDLVSVLMLELDMLQGAQLAGRAIDISRVSDAVKILRSLLPAATTEAHRTTSTSSTARPKRLQMLLRPAPAPLRREKNIY